jgi:hypothetical protein
MNSIAFGEIVHHFHKVLIHPSDQIGDNFDIERSVSSTGEHINAGLLFIHLGILSHPCSLDPGSPCRGDGDTICVDTYAP